MADQISYVVGCAISFIFDCVYALIQLCGSLYRRAHQRVSRRERIFLAQREAARKVDDLYSRARIRMEEAAGRRSPGEHRIGDGFGSWNRW